MSVQELFSYASKTGHKVQCGKILISEQTIFNKTVILSHQVTM